MDVELEDFALLMSPGPVPAWLIVDDSVLFRLGTLVRHLCVGMIDEAVPMTVLSRSSPSSAGDSIGPSRVVALKRGWLSWMQRPDAQELVEIVGGVRPQVFHAMSTELAIWAYDWAIALNAVLVVHMTDLKDVRTFGHLGDYVHTMAVANTAVIERALLKHHPEMQNRVMTVPLGIPGESEVACFARPDRVPAAIMTAPLERSSGVELALKALQLVHEEQQPVHLFVLSNGRAEDVFRKLLDRLKLRSMVTFAGAMHDDEAMRSAMAASDFYIHPMMPERFDAFPLMAMSMGLAILAPKETIEDYMVDGQTALLFEPRPSDLANRWLSLLRDRPRARQLAQGAQEYVRAYHKASFMVCTIAVLYRQTVARLQRMRSDAIAGTTPVRLGDEKSDELSV